MRSLLIVVLLLPLWSCFSDQKAVTARCTAIAKAQRPRLTDQTEEEYINSLDDPISRCMKTAGYFYYSDQPDCDALYSNPHCYRVEKKHHPNKSLW